MDVAIIDYKAGNVYSVIHALERLGIHPVLTDDAERIAKADKVLFPGQGEASQAMRQLRKQRLDEVIRDLRQPILGICIGQQLMCSHSEEGDVDCLGIFDVPVLRFQSLLHEDKVPHMGWNSLNMMKGEKGRTKDEGLRMENGDGSLFKGFDGGEFVYYVHSFYVPQCPWTIATTDYIQPFSAALHRDNFYATQFHPEKSGPVGERILQNFLKL